LLILRKAAIAVTIEFPKAAITHFSGSESSLNFIKESARKKLLTPTFENPFLWGLAAL
jgi:hypothetical protein